MAEDAASLWVLTELEEGKPAPRASKASDIVPDPGGIVNLIALDMDSYASKYGTKAVRKNVTIPAWLNTLYRYMSNPGSFPGFPYKQKITALR